MTLLRAGMGCSIARLVGAAIAINACGSAPRDAQEGRTAPQGTALVLAAPSKPAADLDHCANGSLASPTACTGTAWQNGNLNANQAHYFEGASTPYRVRLSNLTTGSASHAVRIEWDTTILDTGVAYHTQDYLTSYNRTETTANPCSGVTGCSSFSTFPIPVDPRVTAGPDGVAGTADDITQAPGVFTLFGGTLTAVSAYTVTGTYAGSSKTSITITFTAAVDNPVLAWGGHASTRRAWAPQQTATNLADGPYRTRFLDLDGSGGTQERTLASAAVHEQPLLYVVVHVVNGFGGSATASNWTMTVTGNGPAPASFPGAESPGTMVDFAGAGAYGVSQVGPSGYSASLSADCTGTLAIDEVKTCTVTNTQLDPCLGVVCGAPASECLQAGVCNSATGLCEYAPKSPGTACTDDGNACTADACDGAGTCAHPAGNVGATCRASAGVCDPAETCTGDSTECPADAFEPATTLCRASAGACDPAEFCTGAGAACPGDSKSVDICRPAVGICDVAERCDGVGNDCPADALVAANVECRASAGVCDQAESCTGASPFCPADSFLASSVMCRGAAGVCDQAETCTGSSAACPDDGYKPATEECRASAGVCDPAEHCTGAGVQCPPDAFEPVTTQCRASAGVCDPAEFCSGAAPACPGDAKSTDVCRGSAGICDVAERCDGVANDCPADVLVSSGVECRASAGICDVAESCTGTSALCPDDAFKPPTEECRASAGICDVAETCTGTGAACPGDAFKPATEECRASAGICDVAESCTGASAACPGDAFKPATEECRASAGICDVAERCTGSGAACPGDAFKPATEECRASAGVCDLAERCTGSGAACPADAKRTDVCRASAGVCDVPESCDGVRNDCPADAFATATTVCRPVAGACDVEEACTGHGAACPDDRFVASGTTCRPAVDRCDPSEQCSGAAAACPTDVAAICTLTGDKFYDANLSGSYDVLESGIPGWRMTLTGTTGARTASTDSAGTFTFTGLAEGDYSLCESTPIQTNWLQTAPPSVCFSLHVPYTSADPLEFGNLCMGAGGGLSIGYWANKNGEARFLGSDTGAVKLTLLRNLNLRNATGAAFNPTSYAQVKTWLLDATATNMAYMLSAQLASMELAVQSGAVRGTALVYAPGASRASDLGFLTVQALMSEADAELGLHGDTRTGAYRAYQEALKNGLDRANNNLTFAQPAACPFSFAVQ